MSQGLAWTVGGITAQTDMLRVWLTAHAPTPLRGAIEGAPSWALYLALLAIVALLVWLMASLFFRKRPDPKPARVSPPRPAAPSPPAPSAGGTVLFAWTPASQANLQTRGTVASATVDATGLIIQANGPDPQIILPQLSYPEGRTVWVEAELTAPVATQAHIYFLTPETRAYAQAQSVRKDLTAGRNRVRFEIASRRIAGALRFDPGLLPGGYVLHSLRVTAN